MVQVYSEIILKKILAANIFQYTSEKYEYTKEKAKHQSVFKCVNKKAIAKILYYAVLRNLLSLLTTKILFKAGDQNIS